MGKYWLLDQHGVDGPTALVETNGSMQVIDVLRFGPTITELADQQKIWDDVMGRLAPSMKPLLPAAKVSEDGVEVHAELVTGTDGAGSKRSRANNDTQGPGAGRGAGGAKRTGGRGRG